MRTPAPWSLSEKVPITTPLTALCGYLQQWRTILAYALADMEKLGISLTRARVLGVGRYFAHAQKHSAVFCRSVGQWVRALREA